MLLLRAIFSLFQAPTPIRADLPPPPRTNRTQDFVYALIIGSAVLTGFFWLLYLEVTHPTAAASAAVEAQTRISQMKDAESRPVSVSLTFVDDPGASSVPGGEVVSPETMKLPLSPPVFARPMMGPSPEALKPRVDFAPAPPAALLQPDFDLPASAPVAPDSLNAPVPAPAQLPPPPAR